MKRLGKFIVLILWPIWLLPFLVAVLVKVLWEKAGERWW